MTIAPDEGGVRHPLRHHGGVTDYVRAPAELLGVKAGDPVKWSEQVLHDHRGERFNFATVAFHREFRTTLTGTPRAEPG